MIQSKLNLRVLDETEDLLLGHEFEYVYLIDKNKDTSLYLGDIHGDPEFGLISRNNNWCLAGGSWSLLWRKGYEVVEIDDPELLWVVKARQISDTEVEILIDPWSENGALWQLDVVTLRKKKIKDFKLDDEYKEDYDWQFIAVSFYISPKNTSITSRKAFSVS